MECWRAVQALTQHWTLRAKGLFLCRIPRCEPIPGTIYLRHEENDLGDGGSSNSKSVAGKFVAISQGKPQGPRGVEHGAMTNKVVPNIQFHGIYVLATGRPWKLLELWPAPHCLVEWQGRSGRTNSHRASDS
jgi:hypothetical protein